MMNRAFTPEVIEKLLASRAPSGSLNAKRRLLLSIGTPSFPPERMGRLSELIGERNAWDRYVRAADECGYLDTDLIARLRGKVDHNLRSAHAECLVCCFFVKELGFAIGPRPLGRDGSLLDGHVPHPTGKFDYEVKSPKTYDPSLRTWAWNDSETLADAMKKANAQFRDDGANVLLIVPELQVPVATDRYQLVEAFIGSAGWVVNVPRDPAAGPGHTESAFFANGAFIRPIKGAQPAYTRISAVGVIEEKSVLVPPPPTLTSVQSALLRELLAKPEHEPWPKDLSDAVFARDGIDRHHEVELVVRVVHNPNAAHALDESVFARYPQFVKRGPPGNETMEWTDGKSMFE